MICWLYRIIFDPTSGHNRRHDFILIMAISRTKNIKRMYVEGLARIILFSRYRFLFWSKPTQNFVVKRTMVKAEIFSYTFQ